MALAEFSDFWYRQPKNRQYRPNQLPTCSRADVVPFVPLAEAHEGLHAEPGSHTGVFRTELNRQVPQATESVVALNDLSLLFDKADAAAQPAITSAQQLARDQNQGGTVPPIQVDCYFKFF